jgi:hypothetical protein
MKIAKSEIWYLIQLLLTWTFINLTFNMFGLWFAKLLNPAEFTYMDSIWKEFSRPLVVQTLSFGLCSVVAYSFMKKKKLALYSFVALQFIIFHVIFFLNVKIHHGMHFVSAFDNLGMKYLGFFGQYLVDILYLYFPINGNFDNGMFMPANIGTFYLHWILLNIVYYAGLTWIAVKSVKFFFQQQHKVIAPEAEVTIDKEEA